MLYANKVEFQDRPPLCVGNTLYGKVISKIEVYHDEYPDHSEMIIIPYDGNEQLGKFWNYPCAVFYKPTEEVRK